MPAGPVEFVGDGTDGGTFDRVDTAVEQAGFNAVFGDEFGDILSGCLEFMALGAGNVLLADKHGDNAARPFVMQSLDPSSSGRPDNAVAMNRLVTGCWGAANTSYTSPDSTTRPALITATRPAICWTTFI